MGALRRTTVYRARRAWDNCARAPEARDTYKNVMNESTPNSIQLRVIPREQHGVSRKNISSGALRVLYRLNEAGFAAYLVGGAVRDLLLGGHPKDFDVATDATPEDVKKLFRNCRLIGRRFRLAHVMFGPEIRRQEAVPQLPPDRPALPPRARHVRAGDQTSRSCSATAA